MDIKKNMNSHSKRQSNEEGDRSLLKQTDQIKSDSI